METLSNWKSLLLQALEQAPIKTNRRQRCSVYHIQQFIYRALEDSGIENRSPYTLWQLIVVRYRSKGQPQLVRTLCIHTLQQMQKPARAFNSSLTTGELLGILLSAMMLVLPQTATTFRTKLNGQSILKVRVHPIEEIDRLEIKLPSTTDYLSMAGPVKVSPPIIRHVSGLADKNWIKQQKDSAYSLQLLSASNSNSLQRFCSKHNICDQSAFYETEVNGKPIIRLLYGVYNNHQAAKTAKSQLPESLKNVSPWARQFKQIKAEL